jgi:DNA polymerase-3 subunit epsilon
MAKRQIILDTETTGIDPRQGHRIIEIGCVEMINRRLTGNNFHVYVNPRRAIEDEAIGVHGITNEFLKDKPLFKDIADEFFDYIKGGELVIHNAPFDIGHMDNEFGILWQDWTGTEDFCPVVDTLVMARDLHPGQKNNLDALCRRYEIDNTHRMLHGALLDSEILADVYLQMTGGQVDMDLAQQLLNAGNADSSQTMVKQRNLNVVYATENEILEHDSRLALIEENGGTSLWRNIQ